MHLDRPLLFNTSRSLIIVPIDPENFTMAEDKTNRLNNKQTNYK